MTHALISVLRRYVCGEGRLAELADELAAFDWDDESPEALALRPLVGQLELLVEEVSEGLRDEAELRLEASKAFPAAV